MSGWTIYPSEPNTFAEWAYMSPSQHGDCALTDAECDLMIELANKDKETEGILIDLNVDTSIRKIGVQSLYAVDEAIPLFEKIMLAANNMNNAYWRFNLQHLAYMEVLKYGKEAHYVKHVDWGPGFQIRKLSIVIMLSNPSDYDGGALQIHTRHEPMDAPNERGTIIAFPSWTLHGVTPVTRGERRSATAWITGDPFR